MDLKEELCSVLFYVQNCFRPVQNLLDMDQKAKSYYWSCSKLFDPQNILVKAQIYFVPTEELDITYLLNH